MNLVKQLQTGAAAMIAASLFAALGQLGFKVAALQQDATLAMLWWGVGVFAYGPALPLSLRAYRLASLSRMFPLSGLVYVWTTIAAVVWFEERLSVAAVGGTLLVLAGALLIATGARPEEAEVER